MTTANEALVLNGDSDFKSTDGTRHDDPMDEIPFRIPGPADIVSEDSQEGPYKHSDMVGLSAETTTNGERQYETYVPLRISKPKNSEYQKEVLQQWEGIVEYVGDENFTARLRDLTNKEHYPGEMAELPRDDISDDDRELLREGAVFYLTVGRLIHFSGRQERFGHIVFRRLPGWTSSTLDRAEKRAQRLSRFLNSKD